MVAELFEVRRLLATVANNVNQLAKVANISGEVGSRERLEATLAEVDEVVVRAARRGRERGGDPERDAGRQHARACCSTWSGKGKREEHEDPHLVAGRRRRCGSRASGSGWAAGTPASWRGSSTSRASRSVRG